MFLLQNNQVLGSAFCSILTLISNILQVVISEDQFRDESKKLAAHLADPEVEVKITSLTCWSNCHLFYEHSLLRLIII